MRTTPRENITVISNQASEELGRKIAASLQLPFTSVIRKQFKDGEIFHQLPVQDIDGKDVIIVGATHNDEAHQELLDLIDGAQHWDSASVNVVVPYLGYSTMERAKPESGEIPKGITRTRQIFRARPDHVTFVDLHSEAVLNAHRGDVRTKHIQTEKLVAAKIRSTIEEIGMDIHDIVLVSPDYGRSKWVSRIAELLNVSHTAADKDRFAHDQMMVGAVSAVVKDKIAIICDDMIRTGGSITQTADRCREAGARDVMLMATHLVLAGNAREKIARCGALKVIGADTFPGIESDDVVEVYSVADSVADALSVHLNIPDHPTDEERPSSSEWRNRVVNLGSRIKKRLIERTRRAA